VTSERAKRGAAARRSGAGESREAPPVRQRTELAADDPALQGLWEAPPPIEPPRRGGITQSLLGVSPAMRRVFRLVAKIAPTESPVLITGESGTGKELIARAIHLQSRRSHRHFVTVNAAAIPETLFESELFGHVRGSFTGAISDRAGLFQQADGGTLFLDEIGEMPLAVQVKLLRTLQDGEIRRIGGAEAVRVDVRVVAATNRDLREALASGAFREDLYFRLNVFHIDLAPLRERREDIPLLANFFREKFARAVGKRVDRFSERAQFYLIRYDYPGNVRELENAVERAVALAEHGEVTHLDLPPAFREARVPLLHTGTAFPYSETLSLAQLEAEHIRRVLRYFAGNTTRAAKSLGISRSTLWRKMREYGL
jgi:DNA-binding NtrC family response regulator